MKKRSVSILLVLCMTLSLLQAAFATELVDPMGPPKVFMEPETFSAEEASEETEVADTPNEDPEDILEVQLFSAREPYPVEGGNIYFDPDTGMIVDCDTSVTSADMPAEISGVRVTSIGEKAFSGCGNLTSVTIPDSIFTIGDGAFDLCAGLTDVTIPDSVISIGISAFSNCSGLTGITIPNGVTSIEANTFDGCSSLTSVIISNGVTNIGESAFHGCSGLTSITIPNGVTSIGDGAFYNCAGLTSVAIPNGVTSIEANTFGGCSSLTSVTIPNGVTSIKGQAFEGCSALTSITVPGSVTSIDGSAFSSCRSLNAIRVSNESTTYSDIDGVLFDRNETILWTCPEGKEGRYDIPSGVTKIAYGAFSGCARLAGVTIPSGVTDIGMHTFEYCYGLTNITIPSSVIDIGYGAFFYCDSLTSITIPSSVTQITSYAFCGCSSLKNVLYQGTKSDWEKISILWGNECLTNANIYYGDSTGPVIAPISVYSNFPNNLTLTVSENNKGPDAPQDNYQLSAGATASHNGAANQTGIDGAYKIDDFKNMTSLTVEKKGFASVTRTQEQLKDHPQIFLEPVKEGYPTVTAVWLDGVDIRHAEKGIDLLDSKSVTITADVAWDSAKGTGAIKLVQGAKSVTFSGNTVTTVLKDNFDVSKTIYIWAGYDNTYKTMKPLKLKAATAIPNGLDGFKFDFGDKLNFTLPDEIPFLGDTKMGMGLYSSVPVTIEVEDGKIYAAIGYQNGGDYGKFTGWTAKSFSESVQKLKNTLESAGSAIDQYKSIRSAMKAFDSKLARGKGSFGVDADFSIMGFAEGYLDESGTPYWLDSGLIVGISGGVGYSFPFYIGPVPLFFETSLSAEASAQLNLLVREAAKSFTPNGVIEGSIALSGGLGAGIKKVLSLSGGLEGELKDHWEINLDDTDYNRLTAKLKAYAKVGVLFFSGTKKWDLAEKTWEWPDRASLQSLEMEPYAAFCDDLYDPSQYTLISEAEMADNSVFLANDTISLFSAENGGTQESPFAANVYSQAKPQLAAFSDGTLLAVWTGLDNSRATYDRPRLYYALCENGAWGNPTPVDAISFTMESEPSLTIANDTAYLTWCRANAPMGTPVDLAEAAAKLDIFAGVFDRTNNQWTVSQLTNDQTADFSPAISGGSGGVAVVWQSNSANDLFGQSGTTSISGGQYASGMWMPLLSQYNNVGEISNLAVDMSGSVPRIAWTQAEADGAFAVYLDGVRQSSGSGVTSHNGSLYWYQGGQLYQDGQDTGVALSSDRFQIENNTLLCTSGSGLYSTLMAHYYDVSSGRWSDAVALTDGRQSIGSFSAASAGTTVRVLMSSTEVTKEMADIQSDSDDPYGSTNLVLLEDAPVCDLSIGEPWYLEDTYAPGSTMSFHLEVTNNGTVPTNYVVSVSSADGTTNTVISQQRLLPGCTEEVTVAYEQGETLNKQLTFTVKAMDGSDANSMNDQTTLTLQYEDVAVEHIGNGVTEDGQYLVYADIVNRGYGAQSGITVSLYQDAVSGSPLQTAIVDSLDSMCSQPVSFQVPAPADQSCYVIALSHGGTDMNAATDSDFTVCTLQESAPIELTSVDGNQVELWLDGVPAGTLVVAAYDGNRRMDTVGVTSLSGGETEVCVTMQSAVPEDDFLTAYVLDADTQAPLIKSVNLT